MSDEKTRIVLAFGAFLFRPLQTVHALMLTLNSNEKRFSTLIDTSEKRMRNREETFFRCLLDNDFTYHIVEGAYKWDPTYDSETRMTIYEIRRKSADASEPEKTQE